MTPAAMLRGYEVLRRLPEGVVLGAEVGIWRGYMSATLLCRPDVILFMVDSWLGIEGFGEQYSPRVQVECKATAIANVGFAKTRARVMHESSKEAASHFKDGFLDFVFIDADHSYQGVKDDIGYWLPKVKKGGLLGGHDYNNKNYPFGLEVKRAVDEAVEANHWKLDLGRNTTWFVHP